jgi:hypothetical protein
MDDMARTPQKVKVAVAAISVLLILVVGVYRLFTPTIQRLYEVPSPDNRWVAMVNEEEYGFSIFSSPFYAVILRPKDGFLVQLREEPIFQIVSASSGNKPFVRWQTSTNLSVQAKGVDVRDITARKESYKGVTITYILK